MTLNITQANNFRFENQENLRNTARDILARQGASEEASKNVLEKSVFSQTRPEVSYAPHIAIIKASSQISANNPLKETLKYLKSHAGKKTVKEPVLGELWELFTKEELDYNGELIDFEIDSTIINIFAA